MIYLIIGTVAIAVLLNLRASSLVLRSTFCESQRKIIQLIFIWLVPFIGAIMAKNILSDDPIHPAQQSWRAPGLSLVYPPDDCAEIHSHDQGYGCE